MGDDMTSESEFLDIGEPVGRSFEEKLLLAIIDANPEPGDGAMSSVKKRNRRAERLRNAHEALFPSSPRGRPDVNDRFVLRWIGAQLQHDRAFEGQQKLKKDMGTPPKSIQKRRSISILLEESQKKFGFPRSELSRLRKKFEDQVDYWTSVEETHDDVAESIEMQKLETIRDILQELRISLVLDNLDKWVMPARVAAPLRKEAHG